jgi:hypothetical protein
MQSRDSPARNASVGAFLRERFHAIATIGRPVHSPPDEDLRPYVATADLLGNQVPIRIAGRWRAV